MLLVQFDLNPPDDVKAAAVAFWDQQRDLAREAKEGGDPSEYGGYASAADEAGQGEESIKAFAEERVFGVQKSLAKLDAALEPLLKNWSMYRLGTVERCVLRLGAWELLNCPDIPAPIVINESVDLAKFFSSTASGRFVNGVMDGFARARRSAAPGCAKGG